MSDTRAGAQDQAGLQVSVYPLRQPHLGSPVRAAVKAAAAGVEVRVGRLSTCARGDEESVFRAVRAAFAAAKAFGPTVIVDRAVAVALATIRCQPVRRQHVGDRLMPLRQCANARFANTASSPLHMVPKGGIEPPPRVNGTGF